MSADLLEHDEARLRLRSAARLHPHASAQEVLEGLGCIQLDPIDRVGSNADLVLHARLDGAYRRGDWAELHGFEHFAKERCLLPARAFPYYRDQAVQTPWWRLGERLKRLPEGVIEAVYAELCERGPLTAAELSDHGRVEAMDWSGWKGTGKAGSMALEVLWTRCRVVTQGRRGRQRLYDLPSRALPEVYARPAGDFARWSLLERVATMGLLPTAGGPWWSMLHAVRTGPLPDRLVREGLLRRVTVRGSRRAYLVLPEPPAPVHEDERLRILGPLDPLLWDRKLLLQLWDFDYVWEVYKPEAQRRWGYYVCPLWHRGRFVGRVEARRAEEGLEILGLWGSAEPRALDRALQRLASMQ